MDIFLHFLNRDRWPPNLWAVLGNSKSSGHATVLASRSQCGNAILCESRCIAPPGFIFECDIAQGLMERKSAFLRERLFELPMREASLTELVEKKRDEYAAMRNFYGGLFDDQRIRFLADNALGLIPRKIIIGENIATAWLSGPDDNKRLWRPVNPALSRFRTSRTYGKS